MKIKILITLIVLIGLGTGGFFINKNISLPETGEEKTEVEKEEVLPITEEEFEEVLGEGIEDLEEKETSVLEKEELSKEEVVASKEEESIEKPIVQKCTDGTLYGECSTDKPKYCDNGNLINKYSNCGYPSEEQYQVNETYKIISVCGDKKCEGGDENIGTCPRDCESKEEFVILEEGRFAVLVPKGYELLGERHLQDLKYCYPLISNFLGITPYYNTTFLKIFISEKNAGYSNGIGLFYERTKENIDVDFNNVETKNPGGFLYKSSSTYCANTHEFVHVFTKHLSIPSWASEGIAVYTQKNIQKGTNNDFECRQDGWYGFDYWVDEEEKFFPYSDLSKPFNNDYLDINYGPKWYRTAMCLWEYVNTEYGEIKEIFQKFDNLRKESNSQGGSLLVPLPSSPKSETGDSFYLSPGVSFIDEILVPVLGIDIKQVLTGRFGL